MRAPPCWSCRASFPLQLGVPLATCGGHQCPGDSQAGSHSSHRSASVCGWIPNSVVQNGRPKGGIFSCGHDADVTCFVVQSLSNCLFSKAEGGLELQKTDVARERRWNEAPATSPFERINISTSGEGQGGLACCSPWYCKESDTTWQLNNNNLFFGLPSGNSGKEPACQGRRSKEI